VTDTKCLDSSAWLSYYFGHGKMMKEIIDGEELLLTSSLCLFEIKKRLHVLKKDSAKFLQFTKERSTIIVPDISIAEKAAEIAIEKKLGAMDALIYTTAMANNAMLITLDNDFRGLPKTMIVD
jgi:predicted nucleic acid-binding protein